MARMRRAQSRHTEVANSIRVLLICTRRIDCLRAFYAWNVHPCAKEPRSDPGLFLYAPARFMLDNSIGRPRFALAVAGQRVCDRANCCGRPPKRWSRLAEGTADRETHASRGGQFVKARIVASWVTIAAPPWTAWPPPRGRSRPTFPPRTTLQSLNAADFGPRFSQNTPAHKKTKGPSRDLEPLGKPALPTTFRPPVRRDDSLGFCQPHRPQPRSLI